MPCCLVPFLWFPRYSAFPVPHLLLLYCRTTHANLLTLTIALCLLLLFAAAVRFAPLHARCHALHTRTYLPFHALNLVVDRAQPIPFTMLVWASVPIIQPGLFLPVPHTACYAIYCCNIDSPTNTAYDVLLVNDTRATPACCWLPYHLILHCKNSVLLPVRRWDAVLMRLVAYISCLRFLYWHVFVFVPVDVATLNVYLLHTDSQRIRVYGSYDVLDATLTYQRVHSMALNVPLSFLPLFVALFCG